METKEQMITKEQRDKWVKALRSGEYKQTKERLYSGRGYCCLGVYCKAVEGLKLKRAHIEDADENHEHYMRIDGVIGGENRGMLAEMNDEGCDFPRIAEWIEGHIECAP